MDLTHRLAELGGGMYRHYAKWWWAYSLAVVMLSWCGAHFKIAINVTDSLPGKVYLVVKGDLPQRHDEPMAFVWHDPLRITPYPDGITFVKLVAGMPGDQVAQEGRDVTVRGWHLHAKAASRRGVPLDMNSHTGAIPPGRYFVVGLHPDSLDSRYALVGLVRQEDVIGRAYALF